jgi:hypothetical protein
VIEGAMAATGVDIDKKFLMIAVYCKLILYPAMAVESSFWSSEATR